MNFSHNYSRSSRQHVRVLILMWAILALVGVANWLIHVVGF